MLDKIKALLGSLRFWIVLLGAVVAVLQGMSNGSLDLVSCLEIIKMTLISIVGIGTLDSMSSKFGSAVAGRKARK